MLSVVISIASIFTAILIVKSILDFSYSGPQIRKEIFDNYKFYVVYAMARLALWSFIISIWLAGIGILVYICMSLAFDRIITRYGSVIAGVSCLVILTIIQFCKHLLYIPGSIMASSNYLSTRFYPLWEHLSPERLFVIRWVLFGMVAVSLLLSTWRLIQQKMWATLANILICFSIITCFYIWVTWDQESTQPSIRAKPIHNRPNIVMIGSDSLRADRLGAFNYYRNLTPHIDNLARQGTLFTNCFVPVARTAPSLSSLLTGTWPHTHGIRDNYVPDKEVFLPVPSLPRLLSMAGYRTAAISDWAGSDFGKIRFGFDYVDAADDQWNIKYLIRQGPKDIRLFISLFTHNRFGKTFLPEIYYLAGVPLSNEIGHNARALLSEFASRGDPFFLMVFTSNTHLPLGSEYPYYTLYSDHNYRGESKFVMSGLTTPDDIIKKQGQSSASFDVQQIIDLYDGCVRSFDDEVSRIVDYLKESGLNENTIIVIYNDHGLELFDRHIWGQGNSVINNDSDGRIPLIIVDPRRKGGNIVSHVARSIDIAPTLLELVGLPVPPLMEGVSLTPYFDKPNVDLKLPAFYETGIWLSSLPDMKSDHLKHPSLLEILEVRNKQTGTISVKPEFQNIIIESKDRAIRTDRWKLTYSPMQRGAIYQLFDMITDPQGTSDISAQHPEIVEQLKIHLITWMIQDKNRQWLNEHLVAKTAN